MDLSKADRARRCYRRRFDALIAHLGGRCAQCGSTQELTIDHINGRAWDIKAVNRWTRVARYWREAALGLLQVLCKPCNSRKGDPQDRLDGEPLGDDPAPPLTLKRPSAAGA